MMMLDAHAATAVAYRCDHCDIIAGCADPKWAARIAGCLQVAALLLSYCYLNPVSHASCFSWRAENSRTGMQQRH